MMTNTEVGLVDEDPIIENHVLNITLQPSLEHFHMINYDHMSSKLKHSCTLSMGNNKKQPIQLN